MLLITRDRDHKQDNFTHQRQKIAILIRVFIRYEHEEKWKINLKIV